MTIRRDAEPGDLEGHTESGFASFFRSLLAGVPWSERAEGEEVVSLPCPEGRVLRVHNANGKTLIVGEERSDIEVSQQKHARAESQKAAGALIRETRLLRTKTHEALELEVDVPSRWNRRGYVNLTVRVPRDVHAEVVASNGKICAGNLCRGLKARSSNGSVHLRDVVGDVEIATSNAKICCCDTKGSLVARSSNGKIEIEDHSGSLDASTSNGLIRASIEEMGRHGVNLATSNGRIVLELPEEVDAEVDIRVDNGVIRSERELDRADRDRSGQLRGRLGKGGALIRLRTSNGSVSLR